MRNLKALFVVASFILSLGDVAYADKTKTNWVAHPATTILSLWEFTIAKNENKKVSKGDYLGRLVSTESLSWPDGRQALIIYFEITGSLWRCIEYFDASMSGTGEMCFRLEE